MELGDPTVGERSELTVILDKLIADAEASHRATSCTNELDAAGTLAAAEANERTLITAEVRRLELAAHWADLHSGEAVVESRLPGTEHPVRFGGDGTPTVGDFAPAELGCVLRISDGSASRLIADALDLRHRLRKIWVAAQAGQVPAYQGRHIAKATRQLPAEQAGEVDTRIARSLGKVSWGRLQDLLDAAIIEADPVGAEHKAAAAAADRFVRLGRNSEHGLKFIIGRATAGDAIWFKAAIDRIAEILGWQGDTDPVDVRRSKAIGILAQPAEALQLLCEHQDDDWNGPAEPADPADEADTDEPNAGTNEQFDFDESAHDETVPDETVTDDAESTTVPDQTTGTSTGVNEEGAYRSLQILPAPFDPNRARPHAIIYVHLAAEALTAGIGIARMENVGPILLGRLRMLLGEGCVINLKPVIDLPAGHIPVDSYEIPVALREQLHLRYPADVFPYAAAVNRSLDIDHTIPYLDPDQGGPPGQTRIGNLGPLVRRNHRQKPTTTGESDNPNPAPGCGDHPTAASIWSTPPAPIPSASPNSPKPSGTPLSHHRN
jgi:hypothetical protein